ncbi:hypothetical protein [Thalassobaculum sp.]|uniref:DUF7666 domain-containing protein n=2 Tax=Thalassobaculum sp. TaxID=2022740 RepID=UPI0032F07503
MAERVSTADRQGSPASPLMAWHFVDEALRDGRDVPPDGEVLVYDDEVAVCASGLHASERLLDALKYAPGNTICRVVCEDIVSRQDDKLVCRSRTIQWRLDGEELLRDFARRVALDVADIWDIPEVVRKYLETGDENFRVPARAAAREASRAHAARNDVEGAVAGEAARAAAARTHAARATGLAAAWAATKATVSDDAWDRYNTLLETMVEEARQQDDGDLDEWADLGD